MTQNGAALRSRNRTLLAWLIPIPALLPAEVNCRKKDEGGPLWAFLSYTFEVMRRQFWLVHIQQTATVGTSTLWRLMTGWDGEC